MKGRRRTQPQAVHEIGRTAVLAGLIAGLLASGVAMAAAVRTIDLGRQHVGKSGPQQHVIECIGFPKRTVCDGAVSVR